MADSAFPIGGFAYSYGLESAVKHGFFSDQNALRQYLITYSEQLISFDFSFVSCAYLLDLTNTYTSELKELITGYETMLLNPPLQKANCVTGKNWLKICKQLSQSAQIEELEKTFSSGQISLEFPVVFGCCTQLLKFQLHKALNLFFYMSIRDQISAMIRLGVAGPTRAHVEMHFLLNKFRQKIESYVPTSFKSAYKTAYLMEIAQLKHEKVYSKLFQN